jgi:hypothetical protein
MRALLHEPRVSDDHYVCRQRLLRQHHADVGSDPGRLAGGDRYHRNIETRVLNVESPKDVVERPAVAPGTA